MRYRLFSLWDRTIVITIEINKIHNDRDHAKFTNEILNPNCFFVVFEVAIYLTSVVESIIVYYFGLLAMKAHSKLRFRPQHPKSHRNQ